MPVVDALRDAGVQNVRAQVFVIDLVAEDVEEEVGLLFVDLVSLPEHFRRDLAVVHPVNIRFEGPRVALRETHEFLSAF